MSQTTYTYSLSNDFPGGQINSSALQIAIGESSIVTPLVAINTNDDEIDIVFANALSAAERTTLDGNQSHPAGGLIATTPTAPFIDDDIRETVIGYVSKLNMASTQDQPFFITTRPYVITRIVAFNASAGINLAAGGIYTAKNKGGTIYVPATQTYSSLTDNTKYLNLTLNPVVTTSTQRKQELYFSLSVAQLSAATIDLIVYGDDYSTILS